MKRNTNFTKLVSQKLEKPKKCHFLAEFGLLKISRLKALKKWKIISVNVDDANWLTHFIIKLQYSREHCSCTWNLLLLMHCWRVGRVWLKIVSNTLTDKRQNSQQIVVLAIFVEFSAQTLHEPRSFSRVSPRIES